MNEPGELSREDWLEVTARRGIKALHDGEKDFAEEMFIDILCLIGRAPEGAVCDAPPSRSRASSPSGLSSTG